jgi:3-hydroxyacyl-[acyl-carrier-protein] dehydratase
MVKAGVIWQAACSSMRFFMIDKITRWEPGAAAEGIKNVSLSEDFFDDHFPRRPVMPGVLIVEGLAQLSGLLLESGLKEKYGRDAKAVLTLLERTKFRAIVKPGDTLRYGTEVLSVNESGGKVKAVARRGETVVATTEMMFAFKYVDDPLLQEKRNRLMELWTQSG